MAPRTAAGGGQASRRRLPARPALSRCPPGHVRPVTSGSSASSSLGPTPSTASSSSTLPKRPCCFRQSTMRWARTGPTRGSVANSSTPAVFRLIFPAGAGTLPDVPAPPRFPCRRPGGGAGDSPAGSGLPRSGTRIFWPSSRTAARLSRSRSAARGASAGRLDGLVDTASARQFHHARPWRRRRRRGQRWCPAPSGRAGLRLPGRRHGRPAGIRRHRPAGHPRTRAARGVRPGGSPGGLRPRCAVRGLPPEPAAQQHREHRDQRRRAPPGAPPEGGSRRAVAGGTAPSGQHARCLARRLSVARCGSPSGAAPRLAAQRCRGGPGSLPRSAAGPAPGYRRDMQSSLGTEPDWPAGMRTGYVESAPGPAVPGGPLEPVCCSPRQ